MTLFTYAVTYRGQGVPLQDITDFVERIEFTDVGTGEIRSAIIRLNAQDGQFITRANQQGTNAATPIVSQFDMFEIQVIDADLISFKETFEVNILKPIHNTQRGTVLEVMMLGRESYLMKNTFTKQFRFASGFDVSRDIIDFYNDSIPTTLPVLNPTIEGNQADTQDGGSNDLPKITANHYMFAVSELTHYEAMDQTVDKMGAPVSAGGAGNFFEHHYKTASVFTNLVFEAFESGNPPAQQTDPANNDFSFDASTAVIIDDTTAVNPGEEEGGIQSILATQVAVWGQDGIGMLPTENNQFSAQVEAWTNTPEHIPDEFYPAGSLVQIDAGPDVEGDNEHYEALNDTTDTPPSVNWLGTIFSNFAPSQYSKWTDSQEISWRNSSGNFTAGSGSDAGFFEDATFEQLCAWDGNLVVIDETFRRSYADIRAVDPAAISDNFKRAGRLYRGFRVLVDTNLGAPTGTLTGFDDELVQVELHESNGDERWIKVTELPDKSFCAVDTESALARGDGGKVYEFNSFTTPDQWVVSTRYEVTDRVSDAGVDYECIVAHTSIAANRPPSLLWKLAVQGWVDVSSDFDQSNDCYHQIYRISNTQGFFDKENFVTGQNFGIVSAVTFEYRYNTAESATTFGIFDVANYYRIGAWANFKFPVPYSSFGTGQTVGDLYGASDSKTEPATLDQFNMHLTPSGFVGFNNTEAENLGVLDGVYVYTKFEMRGLDTAAQEIEALTNIGNIECRCFLYDTNDTVVAADFIIPFNDLWTPISIPFSEFNIYRGRTPWSLGEISQNVFLQGIEILDVFRYENIKRMCFQWMGPYDKEGRFQPWGQLGVLNPIQQDLNFLPVTYSVKWSFDFFGFSKPMLSVTSPITTGRLLQTQFFQEPLIDNKISLDQTALAQLDLAQFQKREYEIVTEGRFNIPYGFSFFLKNESIILDAEYPVSALPAWVTATDYLIGDLVQDVSVGYQSISNHTSSAANQPPSAEWTTLTDPISNTLKLVNKKTVFTIDKPPTGPGGFLRTITGVKIIES